MACLLIAIIQQNTSNLARLANVLDLSRKVRSASKYKRLQRFCRQAKLDYDCLAKLIMAMVNPSGKYVLALDRTEWRYGTVWVNILTLSIVTGKTSIPIYWQTLNRKGNSTLGEREKLINRYVQTFGVKQLEYLTADREFDSYQFMKYLKAEKMNFRMRVRTSMEVRKADGKKIKFGKMLRNMAVGDQFKTRKARKYGEVKVFIEMEKGIDDKTNVIVISSEPSRQILSEYKRRWAIETLFQNLKSRGFELEETHLRVAERVDKLFGILALAVAWAIKTGELENDQNPVKTKKHGRPQKSLFRLGCEILQEILMEVTSYSKIDIFSILKC
jgi:hypothetical protein